MKKVYLIVVLLTSIVLQAQVVFETSLETAFQKAQEQNKPVFIEYYNSDCPVCLKLGKLLATDEAVVSHYNSNFVNYAMNTNNVLSEVEIDLLAKANLHFESVPILLYFDKDKNFLHQSGAKLKSDLLIAESNKAVSSKYNSSGLKDKYDAGDRSVRTLFAYCELLKIYRNDELVEKVGQELFEAYNKSELATKSSYIILKNVVRTTENGFFQFWINNLDSLKDFETGAKAGTELSHLQTIVLKELSDPNIKNWDAEKKNAFKEYILKLKISENPDVFF